MVVEEMAERIHTSHKHTGPSGGIYSRTGHNETGCNLYQHRTRGNIAEQTGI
jgi:hypothetical protein